MCVHIYIYMYTHIYIYTSMDLSFTVVSVLMTSVQPCANKHEMVCSMQAYILGHDHIYIYIYAYTHTYTHRHIRVCVYIYIYTYIHVMLHPFNSVYKTFASKAGQVQISEETLRDQLTKQCEATAAVSFGLGRV